MADAPTEPVGQLSPEPWMTSPQARAVLAALTAGGAQVRFIGGCVRDALVRRPVKDIDITTPEPPETVLARLEGAGIRAIPTGVEHGTVTAVVPPMTFEITTLRVDVETDGRHARIAYTDDWIADAARRDFTINALSCTPEGAVYDYVHGIDDLWRGRVRFVGRARERIEEDVLRLLRFFRFYAHYGRPPPDASALDACRAKASELAILSGDRVRAEILKTLAAAEPADVVQLMADTGVLEHVLPEVGDVGRLRMLAWLETRAIRFATVAADPVRRLAALLTGGAAAAEAVSERLRMSAEERDRLTFLATPPGSVSPDSDPRDVRRALHRLGADRVRDLVLVAWAGELAAAGRLPRARTDAWVGLIEAADAWIPVAFPLKGRDALALGIESGPEVGRLMRAVEAWWEEGDYRADRDACLARLRTLAAQGSGQTDRG